LDFDTLNTALCHSIPSFAGNDAELTAMLQDLRQLMDADRVRNRGRVEGPNNELLLSNAIPVLTCFLSRCHESVPPVLIFHGHSLLGQIREFFTKSYDGALDAYLKALWIASWSRDIPVEYHARTLHRIGALKGATGKAREARDLLRQALTKYHAAGIPVDHPTAVNCHEILQQYEVVYWSTVGASEDSWSSMAGLSDRRVPLPRIHEEPDSYSIGSSVNTSPRSNRDRRPSHQAPRSSSAHPVAGDIVQSF
jgi:hypothetical protein